MSTYMCPEIWFPTLSPASLPTSRTTTGMPYAIERATITWGREQFTQAPRRRNASATLMAESDAQLRRIGRAMAGREVVIDVNNRSERLFNGIVTAVDIERSWSGKWKITFEASEPEIQLTAPWNHVPLPGQDPPTGVRSMPRWKEDLRREFGNIGFFTSSITFPRLLPRSVTVEWADRDDPLRVAPLPTDETYGDIWDRLWSAQPFVFPQRAPSLLDVAPTTEVYRGNTRAAAIPLTCDRVITATRATTNLDRLHKRLEWRVPRAASTRVIPGPTWVDASAGTWQHDTLVVPGSPNLVTDQAAEVAAILYAPNAAHPPITLDSRTCDAVALEPRTNPTFPGMAPVLYRTWETGEPFTIPGGMWTAAWGDDPDLLPIGGTLTFLPHHTTHTFHVEVMPRRAL